MYSVLWLLWFCPECRTSLNHACTSHLHSPVYVLMYTYFNSLNFCVDPRKCVLSARTMRRSTRNFRPQIVLCLFCEFTPYPTSSYHVIHTFLPIFFFNKYLKIWFKMKSRHVCSRLIRGSIRNLMVFKMVSFINSTKKLMGGNIVWVYTILLDSHYINEKNTYLYGEKFTINVSSQWNKSYLRWPPLTVYSMDSDWWKILHSIIDIYR